MAQPAIVPPTESESPADKPADKPPGDSAAAQLSNPADLFRRDNLVAWCIVPFDDRERTPVERAEMLGRLGLSKYAYDYRAHHIPTFDAEMEAIRAAGIELTAWWFPTVLNDEARLILDVLKRHDIKTQLWVTGGGTATNSPEEHRERVVAEAARLAPIADAAAAIGCRVSLYNHGGWFGEPENQIEIIRELGRDNVGIVYNLHHGHDHLDRFAELLEKMLPHLDCLNLNGMVAQGDRIDKKILPIGDGDLDQKLLDTIARSGYRGPIGILNHTQENAERRLRQNLAGLDSLVERLAPPPAPDPADSSEYSPEKIREVLAEARQHGDSVRGAAVFASAKFACMNCHRIGRHGGAAGPELTILSTRRTADQIVEAVYWPQRTVPPEYRSIAVLQSGGQVLRGYRVSSDSETLVLLDPAGETLHRIPQDDIEEEREIGSLMPDGLVDAMTPTERADLIRFLLELGRDDIWPAERLDETLARARAYLHGPATFPLDREPLNPAAWPNAGAHINRDRIYDFYAKQAVYFRDQAYLPPLLAEFPGLDGPEHGHWGNQAEPTWEDGRWNQTKLAAWQAGVFRGEKVTVPRGVCVQLPEPNADIASDAASSPAVRAVCFNPETLTYDFAWTGDFLRFSAIRSGLMHGLMPAGEPVAIDGGTPPNKAFGYRGFYRHGDQVGFVYRIGETEYLDVPATDDNGFRPLRAPVSEHPRRDMLKGGPAAWPQVFVTPIELGDENAPYAIDTIRLPFDNPWKSILYLGDLAFHPDGSAYVCTLQGDVWRVTGLDYPSRQATWKRFAAGLHQPLGMVIDDDGIFVLGRDQITRLHDLNENGEADFYERFSAAYETSPAGHDYICGLQRDPAGNFYIASGNQGLVKISSDGTSAEVIATGLRNPDGLGLYPDGAITVPNSEGNWVSASMIGLVKPGVQPHFGYPGPRDDTPPDLPMVYLPRALDNSSGGQAWVADDRWGPLRDQMIHFSYGGASHFLILRDEVDGVPQGAVVPLPGDFLSGAHRGRFRPEDGQLYVAGAKGWGNYAVEDGALQRVRYTGRKVQLPIAVRVHQNGVLVSFSEPLDAAVAADPANHFAQVWNYRYGPGYGSPEYSPSHPNTPGHDTLTITAAHVGSDGRSLFIELPELQPVNQLHLYLQVGPTQPAELFVTVNRLGEPFTDFPGYVAVRKETRPHPILADFQLATRSIPNPWRKPIEGAREVRIECTSNLTFGTTSFRAKPGETLRLSLVNPDVVPHNWALLTPGSLEKVGDLTNRYIADPEAPLRHYVPDTPEVLAYTDLVNPRQEFSIYFRAPETAGRYPYLCTFPGHWSVMNGELIVEGSP
ncbi:MAG: heme-binding domain-containing protein [Planctomycetaceae bacterium]|nr:MAG: heme-binding domain-containing protein [Planctomycetaceae bacterium]